PSAIAMEMLRTARRYGSGENGRRATGPLPDMMEGSMAKGLVLYYSSYGHIEKRTHETAAEARDAGASADEKRAPELLFPEAAKAAGYKLDQNAPGARN